MSEIINIQTKLDKKSYAKLRYVSSLEKKTLKDAVREAIAEYVARHEGELEKDPFFKTLGSLETKEKNWSERKDWKA